MNNFTILSFLLLFFAGFDLILADHNYYPPNQTDFTIGVFLGANCTNLCMVINAPLQVCTRVANLNQWIYVQGSSAVLVIPPASTTGSSTTGSSTGSTGSNDSDNSSTGSNTGSNDSDDSSTGSNTGSNDPDDSTTGSSTGHTIETMVQILFFNEK